MESSPIVCAMCCCDFLLYSRKGDWKIGKGSVEEFKEEIWLLLCTRVSQVFRVWLCVNIFCSSLFSCILRNG